MYGRCWECPTSGFSLGVLPSFFGLLKSPLRHVVPVSPLTPPSILSGDRFTEYASLAYTNSAFPSWLASAMNRGRGRGRGRGGRGRGSGNVKLNPPPEVSTPPTAPAVTTNRTSRGTYNHNADRGRSDKPRKGTDFANLPTISRSGDVSGTGHEYVTIDLTQPQGLRDLSCQVEGP